jgi:ubiquinone/menaquinone biosynthesis C-methylase UbiE
MYPFFFIAYRGKNIRQVMHFKTHVKSFSPEKYAQFYKSLNSISRNRQTDLSLSNLNYILKNIDQTSGSLLDVGCGNGFLLKRIQHKFPQLKLSSCDVVESIKNKNISFYKANITHLPFTDRSFDIVVCTHTIEHIYDLQKAVKELLRVCRKQLIVVTPCQQYFYFTLDEHLNFFEKNEDLLRWFQLEKYSCINLNGDWVYLGYIGK